MAVNRFEVWLVNLDPTVGKEIKKTRHCLIISPNEANKYLSTIVGAPMTTTLRHYPTWVNCTFQRKKGEIAIDQLRALDKIRLVKKLRKLDKETAKKISAVLIEYFSF